MCKVMGSIILPWLLLLAAEGDPSFRSKKASEAFARGKDLFEKERYAEALAELRSARGAARSDKDRSAVETWLLACEGGAALQSYRALSERGIHRQTYFQALTASDRFRGTPIAPRFTRFIDELAPLVVEMLEPFEGPSRFPEGAGKRICADPALIFKGKGSLEWKTSGDGSGTQLILVNVPRSWAPYHALSFWVRVEGEPVTLHLMAQNPAAGDQEGGGMQATFQSRPVKGWTRMEMPLERFERYGGGAFENVGRLVIQVDSKSKVHLLLDEIAFIRKDAGAAPKKAAADS